MPGRASVSPRARQGVAHTVGDASAPVPPGPPPDAAGRTGRRAWMVGAAVVAVLLVGGVAVWLWLLRTPLGVVAQAAVATLDEGTAAVRLDATAGGVPVVGALEVVVADGRVSFEEGTARFEREFLGGVTTEVRYTPSGTYLRIPLSDDRWVALGPAGTDASPAATPADARDAPLDVTQVAPGIGNPVVLLALLRALEAPPEDIGPAEVPLDGDTGTVRVTRYRAVIDLEAAAAALDADARDVVEDLRRLSGSPQLPVTVGIDEDGLVRLVRFDTTVPVTGPVEVDLQTQVVFTAFGVPVDVRPPPQDRIVALDASELAQLDPLTALRDLLERVPGL